MASKYIEIKIIKFFLNIIEREIMLAEEFNHWTDSYLVCNMMSVSVSLQSSIILVQGGRNLLNHIYKEFLIN